MALLAGGCAFIAGEIPSAPSPQAPTVVFDIDGTLTPRPIEFFEARPDAAKAVQLFADKGYEIVYLSARNQYERAHTLKWLKAHRFPDGITRVAETRADGQHPVEFKTRILSTLLAKGWRVEYAYGDSSSDFTAYATVAILPDHVFGLRRAGSRHCQPGPVAACLRGWTEHLEFIARAVAAVPEK
jgi:predicted mannosyl-3-phosphoglycerate phosphatase (HAD superfamily)